MALLTTLQETIEMARAALTRSANPPAQEFPFPVFYTDDQGNEYPGVALEVETWHSAIGKPVMVFIQYFFVPDGDILPKVSTGWVRPAALEVLV